LIDWVDLSLTIEKGKGMIMDKIEKLIDLAIMLAIIGLMFNLIAFILTLIWLIMVLTGGG